jgi:chromosome segregation ATPase
MNIEQFAQHVAIAESAVEVAEAAHREAVEKVATLGTRIAEVEQQLQEAQAAARKDTGDMAALGKCGILQADRNDLQGMLSAAEAEVVKSEAAVTTARERVVVARAELSRATDTALFTELNSKAREIESLLLRAIAESHVAGRRLGHVFVRQSFEASKALRDFTHFDIVPPVA